MHSEMISEQIPGLIIRSQSGFFTVQTESGMLTCHLRGRLKQGKHVGDIAAVGDRVLVTCQSEGMGSIEFDRTAQPLAGAAGPAPARRLPAGHPGQPRPGRVRLRLRPARPAHAHAGPLPGHRRAPGPARPDRCQQDRSGGARPGRRAVRFLSHPSDIRSSMPAPEPARACRNCTST